MSGLGGARGRPGFDCVVTHQLNAAGSGTCRFNTLLSEQLGVDLLWVFDPALASYERPVFSFKVSEMSASERERLPAVLSRHGSYSVFLHDFTGLALERRLVAGAQVVYCGNSELELQVRALNARTELLWSPGLVADPRAFPDSELSVFSFGMAHKIQTAMFGRLRGLLDAAGRDYALYVSAADHESTTLEDTAVIFDEMRAIYGERLYFMGRLSDVAVYNYLRQTTLFAAFFAGGVRANNGSVTAAMEHGAVVLTNLDRHSPPQLVHLENVIDINQCEQLPLDADLLGQIAGRAEETAREFSWEALIERFHTPVSAP